MQQENAAGGFSDYNPEEDTCFHDVFERADGLMYEEKKLLKGMGSISREDAEVAAQPIRIEEEKPDILKIKRYIVIGVRQEKDERVEA